MERNQLIQTITAIKVALQSGIGGNKDDMKLAIKIAYGFAEATLKKVESGDKLIQEPVYDDEAPDYITGNEDGI